MQGRTLGALEGKACSPLLTGTPLRGAAVLQVSLRSAPQAQTPLSTLTFLSQLWLALFDGCHDHVTHAGRRQPVQAPLDALYGDDVQVLGACRGKGSALTSLHRDTPPLQDPTKKPTEAHSTSCCSTPKRCHRRALPQGLSKAQTPRSGPTQPPPAPAAGPGPGSPVLSAQLMTAPTGRPREMRNLAPEEPPRPAGREQA